MSSKKKEQTAFTAPVIVSLCSNIPIFTITLALGIASVNLYDSFDTLLIYKPTSTCNTYTLSNYAIANAWFDLMFGFIGCGVITFGLTNEIETLEFVMDKLVAIFRIFHAIPNLAILISWTVVFYRSDCMIYPDLYNSFNSYLIVYWSLFGVQSATSIIGYFVMQGVKLRLKQQ
jgi:hypothetical protein